MSISLLICTICVLDHVYSIFKLIVVMYTSDHCTNKANLRDLIAATGLVHGSHTSGLTITQNLYSTAPVYKKKIPEYTSMNM